MNKQQIINWLLKGDVSIQYQVWRDLLGKDKKNLQQKIATESWGNKFLSMQRANGHWGNSFYNPKWISTHYTLLDLRNLYLPPQNKIVQATLKLIVENEKSEDGGIRLGPSTSQHSDVCVNGMFLNYATYFQVPEIKLRSIVDSISEIMPDGGFNCQTTRSGAKHSSMHSTISVLEGFTEFQKAGFAYRKSAISQAVSSGIEFLLMHNLFLSDHTGEIIDKNFLKLTYPSRWRYDILRAMDYFQFAGIKWDNRMEEALTYLLKKRNKDGTWNMQAAHSGQVHFIMEKGGMPSRWNTLRMLRVLKHFEIE
ncbi:MAG: hypothetical protein IPI65_09345 [Bacteroidetes bacterium]|nr:hypothetical protein [Bacteroidota bacterium]